MWFLKLVVAVIVLGCYVESLSTNCQLYKLPLSGKPSQRPQSFMNCFGYNVENGKSELIILIDDSGSMKLSGFQAAKNFVKLLLSEVRIAFEATRIAIITYTSVSKIRYNYILNPSDTDQKCKFIKEFSKIPFTQGNSNLKAAIDDAYDIFRELYEDPVKHKRRKRTNRVVLVLSDGQIEQKDILAANRLKQTGFVEVYTIAVTKNLKDFNKLKSIASHESLNVRLDQITQFKNLAFNIRGDPYENDTETTGVDKNKCNSCDGLASCGCDLLSGDYKCVCPKGWYGTGELQQGKRTCFECEKDTYGDKRYIRGCKTCPENSHTVHKPGSPATSVKECLCNKGYNGNPGYYIPCRPKNCAPPYDIRDGNIVNTDACKWPTFKTKCYYKCKKDYKMVSSRSYTQCNEHGEWDFPLPRCEVITCPTSWLMNGQRNRINALCDRPPYILDTYTVGTTCNLTCGVLYYQKSGSNKIRCTGSGRWDLAILQCGIPTCPAVPRLDNNVFVMNPRYNCFNKNLNVGDTCEFGCPKGFQLLQQRIIECKNQNAPLAKWNIDIRKKTNLPICQDIEPPKFESTSCSYGISIVKPTLPGKKYAAIVFENINVSDNSGERVSVTCFRQNGVLCPYQLGKSYNIDIAHQLRITFNATDLSGNWRVCRFSVTVKDREKPKLLRCPNNIAKETLKDYAVVTWQEPEYVDNCGKYPECIIDVSVNIPNSSIFPVGYKRTVRYEAKDPSNNANEECKFSVYVKRKTCNPIVPPLNGFLVPVYPHTPFLLKPACKDGFKQPKNTAQMYLCNAAVQEWIPFGPGVYPVPDCLVVDCGDPGQLKNGDRFKFNATTYMSKVRYVCYPGYRLTGSSERICQQNGQWSGIKPVCKPKSCPDFPVINGKLIGSGRTNGSIVRIECNKGYKLELQNLEYRTCNQNGQWTGGNYMKIICNAITCNFPILTSPELTIVLTKGLLYNSIAKYSCTANTCLDGSNMRRCQSNGQWSGNNPVCRVNSCCRPPVPAHATLQSNRSFNVGDKVFFKCDIGYKLGGSDIRECQKDLKWSGNKTVCTVVDCGDPGQLTNGDRLKFNATTYMSKVRYNCHPGYRLNGSSERICQQNGQWSGIRPICKMKPCPEFPVINGQIIGIGRTNGSIVRIECNKGYKLELPNLEYRTCQQNGQWTGGNYVKIVCNDVTCNFPTLTSPELMIVLTNGLLYNSTAQYSCTANTCLDGSNMRRCQSNGQWSGINPVCRVNSCCRPPVPTHATLQSNGSFDVGDKVFIKCDKGYVLSGSDLRECQKDLKWSGNETKCTSTL